MCHQSCDAAFGWADSWLCANEPEEAQQQTRGHECRWQAGCLPRAPLQHLSRQVPAPARFGRSSQPRLVGFRVGDRGRQRTEPHRITAHAPPPSCPAGAGPNLPAGIELRWPRQGYQLRSNPRVGRAQREALRSLLVRPQPGFCVWPCINCTFAVSIHRR